MSKIVGGCLLRCLLVLGTLCYSVDGRAQSRLGLALVIGNSDYDQAPLATVEQDAGAMAASLASLGFTVRQVRNLREPQEFLDALARLLKDEDAVEEDVLVVYYSGHGLQLDGRAHLLGTGIRASMNMVAAVRDHSVGVEEIVGVMERAAPSSRVLIVDACRDNIFAGATRQDTLTYSRAEDTFVLFADQPGKTVPARTDTLLQSPFTAALLYSFSTLQGGIQQRFELAAAKTRQLNAGQSPHMEIGRRSATRDRPFIDSGQRAKATVSAIGILNQSKDAYDRRNWMALRGQLSAARALSDEPALNARVNREMTFVEAVLAAETAERAADPEWAEAAVAWQRASEIFPARTWTHEKAALAWLLAVRLDEAGRMWSALRTDPVRGPRASAVLESLGRFDRSLNTAGPTNTPSAAIGVEFEPFPTGP